MIEEQSGRFLWTSFFLYWFLIGGSGGLLIGRKLSGDQVYAQHPCVGEGAPPSIGWRIPFCGPVDLGFRIEYGPTAEENGSMGRQRKFLAPGDCASVTPVNLLGGGGKEEVEWVYGSKEQDQSENSMDVDCESVTEVALPCDAREENPPRPMVVAECFARRCGGRAIIELRREAKTGDGARHG